MALPSRLRRFEIELADIDRHVYETLSWRVAQHPSEDRERVVVRTLARCLLYEDDLVFGGGLSTVEEPTIWRRDPHGRPLLWVDVGAPSADRVHRASKAADKVIIVSHKLAAVLQRAWSGKRIHDPDAVEVVLLDPDAIRTLAEGLDRQNDWVISRNEGVIHVSTGPEDVALDWVPRALPTI